MQPGPWCRDTCSAAAFLRRGGWSPGRHQACAEALQAIGGGGAGTPCRCWGGGRRQSKGYGFQAGDHVCGGRVGLTCASQEGLGAASGRGPAEAMGRAPAGWSARRQLEGAREYRACWGPPPSPEERHRPGRGPRRQTACCLGLSALLQGSHPQIADRSEGFPKHPLPQNSWTDQLCGSELEAWAPWRLVPRKQGL